MEKLFGIVKRLFLYPVLVFALVMRLPVLILYPFLASIGWILTGTWYDYEEIYDFLFAWTSIFDKIKL